MGWGNKTAAAPRPVTAAPKFPIHRREEDDSKHSALMAHTRVPEETASHDPEPREKPTNAAKAQLEWHQLKSKKGWTDTTLAMILYEFIASKGLFAELIKFTRRR